MPPEIAELRRQQLLSRATSRHVSPARSRERSASSPPTSPHPKASTPQSESEDSPPQATAEPKFSDNESIVGHSDVGDEDICFGFVKRDLPEAGQPLSKSKPKPAPASSCASGQPGPQPAPLPPRRSRRHADSELATEIAVKGFATEYEVWLGPAHVALSDLDLEDLAIKRVVRCTTYRHEDILKMWPKYQVHETVLTVEWADVGSSPRGHQRWNFYKRLPIQFQTLSLMGGNMLFYCKRGFHRSAAILAMKLIYHWPQEDPEAVMNKLRNLRPGVEFFDMAGRCPPLKHVVKGWLARLRQPINDEDTACRRA